MMIEFEKQGRKLGALPGSYKGKRRRGPAPVNVACLRDGCKWKRRFTGKDGAARGFAALEKHLSEKHRI
jgi:hypothetical protein